MNEIRINVDTTDSSARTPTGIKPDCRSAGSGSKLYGDGKYELPSTITRGEYGGDGMIAAVSGLLTAEA